MGCGWNKTQPPINVTKQTAQTVSTKRGIPMHDQRAVRAVLLFIILLLGSCQLQSGGPDTMELQLTRSQALSLSHYIVDVMADRSLSNRGGEPIEVLAFIQHQIADYLNGNVSLQDSLINIRLSIINRQGLVTVSYTGSDGETHEYKRQLSSKSIIDVQEILAIWKMNEGAH
jgi:hypothetical protein